MSKILQVGSTAVTSKVNTSLSSIFNSTNCTIIFLADGTYKSWKPGHALNAITTLVKDKGYIVIMKQSLDVSPYFFSSGDIVSKMVSFTNNTAASQFGIAEIVDGVVANLQELEAGGIVNVFLPEGHSIQFSQSAGVLPANLRQILSIQNNDDTLDFSDEIVALAGQPYSGGDDMESHKVAIYIFEDAS